jgi:hypothetical protein
MKSVIKTVSKLVETVEHEKDITARGLLNQLSQTEPFRSAMGSPYRCKLMVMGRTLEMDHTIPEAGYIVLYIPTALSNEHRCHSSDRW